MEQLEGKVAVVTGGGSGIGEGIAQACAAAGMRVVIADIEADAAERSANSLRESGAEAIADAVRAGRKYARDPIAARDDPETQAADLPADSGAGSATPESEAAAVDADDPEVPEKPA